MNTGSQVFSLTYNYTKECTMLCKLIGHKRRLFRVEYYIDISFDHEVESSRVFTVCERCGNIKKKIKYGECLPLQAYVLNYHGWSRHVEEKDRRIKSYNSD